jgi:hypothetical protein
MTKKSSKPYDEKKKIQQDLQGLEHFLKKQPS